jgi:hypothetical protein
MINKLFDTINKEIYDMQTNKINDYNYCNNEIYDYLKLFILIIILIIIYKN